MVYKQVYNKKNLPGSYIVGDLCILSNGCREACVLSIALAKINHVFQLFTVQVCSLGAMAKENFHGPQIIEKY